MVRAGQVVLRAGQDPVAALVEVDRVAFHLREPGTQAAEPASVGEVAALAAAAPAPVGEVDAPAVAAPAPVGEAGLGTATM